MMKNARWDNEVVLDYIEQHDSDAFKKHDEKVLKKGLLEQAKASAKKMLAKKIPIEEIIEFTELSEVDVLAIQADLDKT